jgi:D-amino-acid dehydrogenase
VVVVGGGLVGAASAFELASDGRSVLLVDREDVGRASDAGAGIISPETITHRPRSFLELVDAAGRHLDELVGRLAEVGAPDPSFTRCGSMVVATLPGEDEWFAAERAEAMDRHPGVLEDLDPSAATELFPALGEVRAALFNRRAARVDGRALTGSLRAAARAAGATIRSGSATGLDLDGGRVRAVVIDGEPISCGAVVLTGGAWTPELAAGLGLATGVTPLRGQIVHLRLEGTDTASWPIVEPVLGFYAAPWPGGRIAVGGTMEDVGFDPRVTADGLHQLLREALRTAPGLAGATYLETRVGLRPMSADEHPTIGEVPGVLGVLVAAGHGTNGLLLGPLTGRIVAELVDGASPAVDVGACSPARWAQSA